MKGYYPEDWSREKLVGRGGCWGWRERSQEAFPDFWLKQVGWTMVCGLGSLGNRQKLAGRPSPGLLWGQHQWQRLERVDAQRSWFTYHPPEAPAKSRWSSGTKVLLGQVPSQAAGPPGSEGSLPRMRQPLRGSQPRLPEAGNTGHPSQRDVWAGTSEWWPSPETQDPFLVDNFT